MDGVKSSEIKAEKITTAESVGGQKEQNQISKEGISRIKQRTKQTRTSLLPRSLPSFSLCFEPSLFSALSPNMHSFYCMYSPTLVLPLAQL